MSIDQLSPLFYQLCDLFESIQKISGTEKKKERLRKYLYQWRDNYGYDFFDAMRLLLPHLDKRRYNMKEMRLAKVYTDALGIARTAQDAIELAKFKQPAAVPSSENKKAVGDFAGVAYDMIKHRSVIETQPPTQTVHDVNVLLDRIVASSNDEKAIVGIFKNVLNTYNAFEQKWLIRIILKDLKIGMTDNSVLQVYHPQARDMYAVCSNLEKVCTDLKDPAVKLNKSTVSLFHPFKPQLGHRDVPKDVSKLLYHGRYYIEEKIDGERMQMHFEKRTQRFMWMSRRSTDYTELYGGSPGDGKLAAEIIKELKADSMILDGEMVAYDPKLDVYLPFGTLKSSAKDDSLDPHKARPCFIVFDIVFCNGCPLLDYPLEDRLRVLNSVVTEKPGALHILSRLEKSTKDDYIEALNNAISLRQEGIVLKNPGSIYEPGTRNHTWIKIKPEYIDSLNDNCDLLVIGAKYGSGRRGNRLSQFLCAIRDDRAGNTDDNPKFMTFAMLGTGYTLGELDIFKDAFENATSFNPRRHPPWLIHPERSDENPDVIIDYTSSLVVEVKAAEIVYGNQFGASWTLRFPRFISFRQDKAWKDVMSWNEMNNARRQGTIAGQKRRASEQNIMDHKRSRQRQTASKATKLHKILESQQGLYARNITTKSMLFSGLTFCVATGDNKYTKHDLEALIKENGGAFIQQARAAQYIIAGDQNIIVQAIISQKMHDVIIPQWLVDCVESQDMVPLSPKYMLYTTEKTKKAFEMEMDPWGDSYTQDATEKSLKESMSRVLLKQGENIQTLANEIQSRYFPYTLIPGRMFQQVKAYIDDDPPNPDIDINDMSLDWVKRQGAHERLSLAATNLRFYGAEIVQAIEPGITHVIFDKSDLSRLPGLNASLKEMPLPYFVTTDWVDACVSNRTLVDERNYEPKVPRKVLESSL
ncbi:ATP dependent DNA ligase domain-containing protein [Dichotomocladium elegans]|nr:ATP dependent DNA ligase domain-containing protein [Dichotomocladium elegans]